jgi:hypothetical protein
LPPRRFPINNIQAWRLFNMRRKIKSTSKSDVAFSQQTSGGRLRHTRKSSATTTFRFSAKRSPLDWHPDCVSI